MSRPKRPSKAAADRKRARRYLTELIDAGGQLLGYRFTPGPHLRAKGAASAILKRPDGSFMSYEEARLARDAAIASIEGRQMAATPAPAGLKRTLNALWTIYHAAKRAEIEAGETDDGAISAETLRQYKSMIKRWLVFAGDDPVAALDADAIVLEYKNHKRDHSHHAAQLGLAALKAVLTHGVRIKWLTHNPALGLGLSTPDGRLRLASPEELETLVSVADAIGDHDMADAIIAAVWTVQRQGDLLACELDKQMQIARDIDDGAMQTFLIFARTHEGDYSQEKRDGQAQVLVLPPLAERLRGRTTGFLIPGRDGGRCDAQQFQRRYRRLRAIATKQTPSLGDLKFQDLRDTGITRLHLAGVDTLRIALWSGHSLKSIQRILEKHYVVATREASADVGARLDQWRKRRKVRW